MANVKVLIEGYANEKDGRATCSAVLIQDKGKNIIVDPGINRQKLLNSLKRNNLSPDNVDYVVISHTHLDHCALVGIFTNATILDNSEFYTFDGKWGEHKDRIPGTDVQIIKTPGHDQFHCSVIAEDEKLGKVAVAADVFWWWDGDKQRTDKNSLLRHVDPYVKNKKELLSSRKKLLKIADYIIPGHGKPFKIEKY